MCVGRAVQRVAVPPGGMLVFVFSVFEHPPTLSTRRRWRVLDSNLRLSRIRAFEQRPRQWRLQHRDRDERDHVAEDLHACSGRDIVAGWVHLPALPEMAAKDENLGMPSMTAELSTRAVLSVAASVVEDAKQGGGDIPDAVKSRLLV